MRSNTTSASLPQLGVTRAHVSKHRLPFCGKVHVGPATGLRKLMRAARRGLVPQDRIFLIEHAMRTAAKRPARHYGNANRGNAA